MSPHKHKKLLSGFLAFVGIPALLLAPIIKSTDAHAEGSSSYFDANAAACVVYWYNENTGSSVTSIEQVNFDEITNMDCSNRNITHFRGIVLLKNLEWLSLSNNPSLATSYIDFSQNTKLKHLNLYNAGNYYSLDLSNNPDLEDLTLQPTSGYTPYVTLYRGVEKLNDNDEYAYGIDLNNHPWWNINGASASIDGDAYPYKIDGNQIAFKDKTKIPYSIRVNTTVPYGSFDISTRSGYMNYHIFLEGNAEVETHNPIYLNNNCEPYEAVNGETYYNCSNSVYYGDEFDSNDVVENTLKKIFNLDAYDLSKVEIVPPTANVELEIDTDTVKKGKALSAAGFSIDFHFSLKTDSDSDTPHTPNTGFFTKEDGGVNVANIAITLAGISVLTFIALGLRSRFSAKSRVRKF